jgi:hypothetical protein
MITTLGKTPISTGKNINFVLNPLENIKDCSIGGESNFSLDHLTMELIRG